MEAPHRMKVKLGPNEFEAEGKAELVKKQYADFLAMVAQFHGTAPAEKADDRLPETAKKAGSDADANKAATSNIKIDKAILERVFRMEDPLSLMDTPNTDNADADALLVLIYGHTEMAGRPDVTGTMLVKSAGKTGLNIDRVSRTVEARRELIRSSGVKKGTRYSLNNRGIAEAERLIKAMVE
jgi:hypothetical protein